jgi:hypothetical protein
MTRPPCTAYIITLSSGSAVCRLRSGLPPTECFCRDYSPDREADDERARRWHRHLLIDRPHDLDSHLTGDP